MANEIEKFAVVERAANGKRVRSSKEEVARILHPMFLAYVHTKPDKDVLAVYVGMLQDIEATVLHKAVIQAMQVCKFLPTIADIREQIETREPGPASPIDQAKLDTTRPMPTKMYRLPDDEDKAARMAQLRRTKDWRYA